MRLALGGEAQQAQEVGYGGAFLAHALAQALLCHRAVLEQFLVCQGYLDGVEVLALYVLYQGHLGELRCVGLADVRRDGGESGPRCRTEPALAGYDLIPAAGQLAQRHGLYDAEFAHRLGQFVEGIFVKQRAGLVGVGGYCRERHLVYGGGVACWCIVHRDERVEASPECRAFW